MKTLMLLFVLITGSYSLFGAAAIPNNRPNSIGITESYSNPNTYVMGVPLEATPLDGGKYFSIRISPYNTYSLYDESYVFCGDVLPKFEGKNGVIVLTFETRAHTMYKGLACHELVSVFEVR